VQTDLPELWNDSKELRRSGGGKATADCGLTADSGLTADCGLEAANRYTFSIWIVEISFGLALWREQLPSVVNRSPGKGLMWRLNPQVGEDGLGYRRSISKKQPWLIFRRE